MSEAITNEQLVEVNYDDRIPNNVALSQDKALRRALEKWQPDYVNWWLDMGPEDFQEAQVYLRTAVGVDRQGWAKFGYVKMPEYRWGVLLAPQEEGRTIPCGKHKGEPVWQEVPGEYRAMLRRLLVIQGDTEPASVEQQRHLGKTCPSLYDLRNLFQVNVEEGRHLWAIVYLLQKYFGRDGREEAAELLNRRSGNVDKPRILGAFNEETPDWLSFFMFTFFTDRDGKMQLESLAQSGFDPLSRTTRFMLMEEAFHMFVGESGVSRIIERICQAMNDAGITDPQDVEAVRKLGVIDLPLLQRKANFHIAVTRDLFGAEISTNGANSFNAGLKGRFHETKIDDDHQLLNDSYSVLRFRDGSFIEEEVPALSAINCRLLDDYVKDCQGGINRWNKIIQKAGLDFQITQPHRAFNRNIGEFRDVTVSPAGELMAQAAFDARRDEFLPNQGDYDFLNSLMQPVTEPGKYASWIAPPRVGVNQRAGDFEYVKIG